MLKKIKQRIDRIIQNHPLPSGAVNEEDSVDGDRVASSNSRKSKHFSESEISEITNQISKTINTTLKGNNLKILNKFNEIQAKNYNKLTPHKISHLNRRMAFLTACISFFPFVMLALAFAAYIYFDNKSGVPAPSLYLFSWFAISLSLILSVIISLVYIGKRIENTAKDIVINSEEATRNISTWIFKYVQPSIQYYGNNEDIRKPLIGLFEEFITNSNKLHTVSSPFIIVGADSLSPDPNYHNKTWGCPRCLEHLGWRDAVKALKTHA